MAEKKAADQKGFLSTATKKLQMIQGLIDANTSEIKKLLLLQNEK